MKKCELFIVFILFIPRILAAQEKWEYHTNDNYISCLAVEKNYVWTSYGLSGYGVVRWDKNTGEYTKYTTKDGLPDNSVQDIAIDNSGYKWFATMNGLAKYDGFNWTIYGKKDGMPDGYVKIIQTVSNGPYWFVTASGVTKYTGTYWFNYTTNEGLAANNAYGFAAGYRDEAWALSIKNDRYLFSKYDGSTWTVIMPKDITPILAPENDGAIISLYLDKFGKLWIGSNKGVIVYDGKSCVQYTTENGLISNNVYNITSEKDETFWFSTNKGVSCFDGTSWTSYTSKDGLSADYVWETAIDSDGNKWFATVGGGLSSFDGVNWKIYKTNDWLPYAAVNLVSVDRKGEMWLALSSNQGVCRYDGSKATAYKPGEGLGATPVKAIAHDSSNNVWFGYGDAGGGVTKFNGHEWTTYSVSDGLGGNKVYAIAIDRDESVWFATSYGASRFDGKNWTTYHQTDGLVNDVVTAIAFDTKGNKWFGTMVSGISKFDGSNWTTYTKNNGLIGNSIKCIKAEENGNVWVGSVGGLSMFDGTNWFTYTDEIGINYPSSEVSKIEIDGKGNKWILGNGVFKYDGVTWKQYKTNDGLMYNYVSDVTKDKEGNLLFAEVKGISKLITDKPSAVDEENRNMPMEFSLSQNYPNPFNPTTTIRFNTPRAGFASLKIYNILGQEVKTVLSEQLSAGTHEVKWNGTDEQGKKVSSGVYIYRLETNEGYVETKKMAFLK